MRVFREFALDEGEGDPENAPKEPDGGKQNGEGDHFRIERRGRKGVVRENFDGEDGAGENGADVAFEKVGAEPCDVADVIAHIVRDGRGIAGVILGDVRLRLSDEVCTHVGGLGVDASAHAIEHCNDAAAERIPRENEREIVALPRDGIDVFGEFSCLVEKEHSLAETEGKIDDEYAQKGKARDAQPHDASAAEGNFEGFACVSRLVGGVGDADVCIRRDLHADESRKRAHQRADEEGDHRLPGDDDAEHGADAYADDGDNFVLVLDEGVRTFADGRSDLLHPLISLFELADEDKVQRGIGKSKQRCKQHEKHNQLIHNASLSYAGRQNTVLDAVRYLHYNTVTAACP